MRCSRVNITLARISRCLPEAQSRWRAPQGLPATSTAKAALEHRSSSTRRESHPIKTARISSSKWRGNTRGSSAILSPGPLTDVALALEKAPEIAKAIACITVMGGGIHAGNATRYAEFNIVADPEAANVGFGSGVKTVMIRFGCSKSFRSSSRARTSSFCARRPSLEKSSLRCYPATRTFTSRSITSTA